MKTSTIIKIGVGIVFAAAAIYSLMGAEESFGEKLQADREQYEKELRFMEGSPMTGLDAPLQFFEYNEDWKVKGQFEVLEGTAKTFTLMMTDSTFEQMNVAGKFHLDKDGQHIDLYLFDEGESYLLPFVDQSSGKETYGGGRYLNVSKSDIEDEILTIDFNDAHNFYCAYSEDYVCPIPPKENLIPLAVMAGEKTYKN